MVKFSVYNDNVLTSDYMGSVRRVRLEKRDCTHHRGTFVNTHDWHVTLGTGAYIGPGSSSGITIDDNERDAITSEGLCLGLCLSMCVRHVIYICLGNLRQEREQNHRLFDPTLIGDCHMLGFCVTGPHLLSE